MKGWTKVFVLGFAKLPLKIAALFVVPFLNDEQRVKHPIWGCNDATDLSWNNIAFRNGVHNLYELKTPQWITVSTNTPEDPTLEKVEGFQYRYRKSDNEEFVSFRMTWGKPDRSKGKNEFYVGWTMNEKPTMRLTFFQLRPIWHAPVAIFLGLKLPYREM